MNLKVEELAPSPSCLNYRKNGLLSNHLIVDYRQAMPARIRQKVQFFKSSVGGNNIFPCESKTLNCCSLFQITGLVHLVGFIQMLFLKFWHLYKLVHPISISMEVGTIQYRVFLVHWFLCIKPLFQALNPWCHGLLHCSFTHPFPNHL